MMRSTFGAPEGGTTVGGHQGVDSRASRLMTPPNGGASAGSDWPLIVDVALGAPSVPVTCCWPAAGKNVAQPVARKARKSRVCILDVPYSSDRQWRSAEPCPSSRVVTTVYGRFGSSGLVTAGQRCPLPAVIPPDP